MSLLLCDDGLFYLLFGKHIFPEASLASEHFIFLSIFLSITQPLTPPHLGLLLQTWTHHNHFYRTFRASCLLFEILYHLISEIDVLCVSLDTVNPALVTCNVSYFKSIKKYTFWICLNIFYVFLFKYCFCKFMSARVATSLYTSQHTLCYSLYFPFYRLYHNVILLPTCTTSTVETPVISHFPL